MSFLSRKCWAGSTGVVLMDPHHVEASWAIRCAGEARSPAWLKRARCNHVAAPEPDWSAILENQPSPSTLIGPCRPAGRSFSLRNETSTGEPSQVIASTNQPVVSFEP